MNHLVHYCSGVIIKAHNGSLVNILQLLQNILQKLLDNGVVTLYNSCNNCNIRNEEGVS